MIAEIIDAAVEESVDWWLDRRDEKRRAKNEKNEKNEKKGEGSSEDR